MARVWKTALLVLSDKAASGERPDACLPLMRAGLPRGFAVTTESVLPDERRALEELLRQLCDADKVDVILTSGGTGIAPRDITPEATHAVADYHLPGIGEAMRQTSLLHVPTAMLSRAIAVVRGATLIINLPGNPKAVVETLAVVAPVLGHACELLHGAGGDH